ncbi:MAG: zinc-binding dehydrogenase [Pirellulales bacterium]
MRRKNAAQDVVFELTGSSPATSAALEFLRIGGRMILVGAVFPTPEITVLPERLVRRQLTLSGIHNYTPRDLVDAVAFLAAEHARVPFAELVTAWYPLGEIDQALAAAQDRGAIRIGVGGE